MSTSTVPKGFSISSLLTFSHLDKDFLEEFVRGPYESMGFYTYRTYDTFGHSHINTAEPANMQAVLNSKFLDYDLGPKRAKKYEGLLGEGIFTAEGERWRYFRQQLRPFFSKDPVGELDSAEKHVTILFQALPAADPQGWIHKVDLMPRLLNFTMDTSAEFLFGKSTNSQLNSYLKEKNSMGDAGEFEGFSDAMDSALEYVGRRFKLELPFWLLPSSRKFRRACQTIQKFTNHAVQVALQSKDKECKRSEMKSVLLHELATTTRNPAELGQQALHVLAAGRETTASAAGYAIMLLSRHPQEYARIRDIVLSYFGTEEAPLREMTASALRACKPVQDVVYEALRLYPSVAVSSRVANKDTILPRGGGIDGSQPIAVRKGEEVKYSAYVMQRRHDIWGKDADEFCPTRWETRKLGPDIIPFSIGPRTCLGSKPIS